MLYPLILTSLAGFATLIGIIPIFVKIKNKDNIISAACAFASGVMICILIFDLIPESISYLNNYFDSFGVISLCFLFIVTGIILSMILDSYIDKVSHGGNLFKVGILSMIAIILHNIPEDCSCYASQLKCNINLTTKYIIILVVYLVFISVISIHLPFVF